MIVIMLAQTPNGKPMLSAFDRYGGHAFVQRTVQLVRAEVRVDIDAGTGPG